MAALPLGLSRIPPAAQARLMWTEGLTVEIKLRIQISLVWCGGGLNYQIEQY